MMDQHVPNDDLRLEDIPMPEATWSEQSSFAYSFLAYDQIGERLSALAASASKAFRESGAVPASLTDLRACLFYEHRRAVHFGAPTDHMKAYARALLTAIRERVALAHPRR
jgi:hypothetical protein